VWCFRDTHFGIVHSDFKSIVAVVTRAVVIVVVTIRDSDVADVVLFNLADFANLVAYPAAFVVLHLAVEDCRTALVISNFYLFILAVETLSCAFLVYAMVDCSDTHVCILCKVLPVEAFQAFAVAIIVVAVFDGCDTAAV